MVAAVYRVFGKRVPDPTGVSAISHFTKTAALSQEGRLCGMLQDNLLLKDKYEDENEDMATKVDERG